MSDLTADIEQAIESRLWPLEALLGAGEEFRVVRSRLHASAPVWAAQLVGDDDKLAAQTAVDLVAALFPRETPIPDEWWATLLGRAVAASCGYPGSDHVSFSVAAARLGVSKGRIQQLVTAGKLERHSDGGVTTASLRSRNSNSDPHQ